MIKVFVDTNILLDLYGCSSECRQQDTIDIMDALIELDSRALVIPAQIKDFRYLLARQIKLQIKQEKGDVSQQDALAVAELVRGAHETLMDLVTIASESLSDCEMARTLCKRHNDFEDNLIAAVALRSGANCLITRDAAFAKHCPVKCLSPREFLANYRDGIYQ